MEKRTKKWKKEKKIGNQSINIKYTNNTWISALTYGCTVFVVMLEPIFLHCNRGFLMKAATNRELFSYAITYRILEKMNGENK